MNRIACLFLLTLLLHGHLNAQELITNDRSANSFPVVSSELATTIVFDITEDSLIHKSVALLQQDIEAVTGKKPSISHSLPSSKNIIVIGNFNKSSFIKKMIETKKLDVSKIKNTWEAYQLQTIKSPFKGIDKAFVITGNDRRGTAYGVLELSKQIGVSPWYWWADVPVKKKKELYVNATRPFTDHPKVKYRGIFINDEAPALANWSKEKFGGFNHLFYEKVFELMLRLKANYLWPAMWGSAFYDDDPLNKQTADNYGIVIGTSHHEPLMRAHDEWRRYGTGKWNYDSNEVALRQFWKEGMQRATNEKIVSIGMRGDGDEPMTRETATALLERIVKDQRQIIEEVTGKPAEKTPQLWALYKEVQDYYDKGMRVPDDVTLLLCDDNWGNIRRLPKLTDPKRKGGYGIYYHFDYVGGPRNYKWINTNNLARVWEQMHLAWEYGARQIWIVNVGDIKPMELPTSFFLEYAWDPAKWNEDNIPGYYTQWAAEQFGATESKNIGSILCRYSQYAARIKPELLNDSTYSLFEFGETERIENEWLDLLKKSEDINNQLPATYKDAFFQLVLHPVKAFSNLHQMYFALAKNRFYAAKGDSQANDFAAKTKQFFINDSLITQQYHLVANGKWNHMMDQTHIGYTYWQQPPFNKMPVTKVISEQIDPPIPPVTESHTTKQLIPKNTGRHVFYELDNYVSIEAEHWSQAKNSANIRWKVIPGIGRDGSGVTTFPVTKKSSLSKHSPCLEYEFYTHTSMKAFVYLFFSPTLNFVNEEEGLQFAISVDDEVPQIISLNANPTTSNWNRWVSYNTIVKVADINPLPGGKHILKYWMISPGVIFQKAIINFGGMKYSYLGPPETGYSSTNSK